MDPKVDGEGAAETPLTMEGLTALLATERKMIAEETAKVVDSKIEALKVPDRSSVEALAGQGNESQEQIPEGFERTSIDAARGVAVSRTQPLDYFYRKMSPEERLWRSPEADHWGAEWLRAQLLKNHARMQECYDKSEAWIERSFGRADLLEGTAGASGALSAGTAGPLIPRPLEELVLIARDRASTMRRFARPFPMSKQTHTIPTSTAMTFATSGEESTGVDGQGTIASVQMRAIPGTVKAIVGIDALADIDMNLISLYNRLAGSAIGAGEDVQFWSTGDGALTNISSKVDGTAFTETTSGALAFVDVVDMIQAVPQAYRQNTSWYSAADVVGFLSLVVDANSGRQFYSGFGDSVGLVNDDPSQIGILMRRPVFEVPCPDGVIMVGDMESAYTVGTRQNIEMTASEHFLFDTRKIVWLWTTRFDGQDIDAVAIRRAAGITSATRDIA